MEGVTLDVAGGRDVPWMWLGVGVDGYTLDVAWGRDACGWGLGWMDVPWM